MIHPGHREAMRRAVALLALLTAGLAAAWLLPERRQLSGIAGYVPLHLALETVSIVVASLVFAVGWSTRSREQPGPLLLLAFAFLGVAVLDFSHALSFSGMPDYVTPAGPEKAIGFWLAARTLAAVSLLAASFLPWRPFASAGWRWAWPAAVLALVAGAHAVFLLAPQSMPRTFVPGQGLTPIKLAAEYLLVALYLASGAVLVQRMRRPLPFNAAALFCAVCTMALSELFFTLYADVGDLYNLLGHVYKVVSYAFLYRALFVETIERPIVQLRATEARLRTTVETIPDPLWLKDAEGVYLECNRAFEQLAGVPREQVLGRTDRDLFPPDLAASFRDFDRRALEAGRPTTNEEAVTLLHDGRQVLYQTVKTPMRHPDGKLVGVLGIARDITEARSVEQAFLANERRLKQAVRVARIGIFDHDHDTDQIYWSPEQRALYGIGPDLPITLDVFLSRVLPEDVARMAEAVRRAHDPAGDGLFDVEHRIVRADGAVRTLSTRSLTSFAGEGVARRKVRTVGAVLDVTDRNQVEEVLRSSQQSLAVTLQSIADAVIATDLEGRVTRMNTVAERLTGWPFALACGRPLDEVFDVVDMRTRTPAPSPVVQVLASGEVVTPGEHTLLRGRHGRDCPISDRAAPIRDSSGRVMGVVLVFSDVTEQDRAQRALLAQTEALRLRDRALTQISQGVIITDEHGRISYVNPGFEQLTGYAPSEAIGRDPSFLHGPDTSPATLGEIAAARRDGREFRGEVLHVRKDGTPLWIALDVSPVRDDAGHLTGSVQALRDVTDRRQAEAQRRSLQEQLRQSQKMESIGTLAGGIAHDFNNILGAILGNVVLARGDLPPAHPALASLEQIQKAGLRARELVRQILTFSRRQPQQMENQPLRPLVEESLAMLRSMLPAGVQLVPRVTDAPVHADVDGTQIQQVLINLCTNAWQALPESAGRVEVGLDEVELDSAAVRRVGALSPGRHAHLWVEDGGIGMDEVTLARIFEPFFTTKPAGVGTGLGLAVVHGIVAAHRGGVEVRSRPGFGTTFDVYLPSSVPVPAPPPAVAAEAPPAMPGGGQHVLVVDDDEVMVTMVERLLERAGYRVTCCRDMAQALAEVRADPLAFDVVVSDYNMPSGSGLELAERLAAIRPDLPVVISTGFISEALRAGARALGVAEVFPKEDTFVALPPLLGRLLAR